MWEEWKNFEIMGFNNHVGWAPRFLVISHIFWALHKTGNNLSTVNQRFIKSILENQVDTRTKTFLTSINGHPANVKYIE